MRRHFFALAVSLAALCLQSADVLADDKLTAGQIQQLLDGRTALGNWRGTDTRQYFETSGATVYLPEGGVPDEGKWKVDEAKDQYCSWWQRGGWACYDVETDGTTYYWVTPGDDYRSPFTMTDGRQMSF
ncbi:hypothetical protein HBA54_09970 [Pelagibius litoralis]|uniref:DUF995 domain-containing protein n=1 Tax=Pelagibius litoralis TaxID=374515 RepID=A0A967C560_9PROT|nr:hypothetical protein [Pelagibius litoralis]NIA68919.1 hypothetical protein [Pelagibius litoralis]